MHTSAALFSQRGAHLNAYIEFSQQWVRNEPPLFFVIAGCFVLVPTLIVSIAGRGAPNFFRELVSFFFFTLLGAIGVVLCIITVSFFIPKPYDKYLMFGISSVVLAILFLIPFLTHRRKTRSSSSHQSPTTIEQQRAPITKSAAPPPPADIQSPSSPFSNIGLIQGMALRLKRHERPGTLGAIIFTLDARIDVSAENRALIEKYKLGNRLIYDSANREKYAAKARQHIESTRDQPGLFASPGAQAWGFAKTIGRLGAAAVNATASALSLRITVNSLMAGVHVECKDMHELLEAEDAIKEAGFNLKSELESATTFTGQEQVIDL